MTRKHNDSGHKAPETTCNINNTFGPGTANECTVQWWFKKFCKGDKSLEVGEHNDCPLEVDNSPLKGSSKLIHLQPHGKLQRTQHCLFKGHFTFEARWKSEKV